MNTSRHPLVPYAWTFAFAALALTSGGVVLADDDDVLAGQAVVVLVEGASIDELNADHGTTSLGSIDDHRIHLLALPEGWTEAEFEAYIEEDPRVDSAEPNYEGDGLEDAVDGGTQGFFYDALASDYDAHYAWQLLGVPVAHTVSRGAGVIVAVLDTGIDRAHERFAGVSILPGYDLVDDDAVPDEAMNGLDDDGDGATDELFGHGTFMSGLVATLAPEATILPVRVLDTDGRSESFRVAAGVYWAVDQGASVINLSLGSPRETEILEEAIDYATEAGVVVVAPAGNLGVPEPVIYPAAESETICVAATDAADVKSDFSGYGAHVDLTAPGGEIVSFVPGGYARADGTSTSTSLVSAAAALVRSAWPSLGPSEVRERLAGAAANIDVENPAYAGLLGGGRLDVAGALDARRTGDVNGDHLVDFSDVLMVLGSWGPCPAPPAECPADVDADGSVSFADLLVVMASWG